MEDAGMLEFAARITLLEFLTEISLANEFASRGEQQLRDFGETVIERIRTRSTAGPSTRPDQTDALLAVQTKTLEHARRLLDRVEARRADIARQR